MGGTKTFHFIRHGYSEGNRACEAALADRGLVPTQLGPALFGVLGPELQHDLLAILDSSFDCGLTPLGKGQARALQLARHHRCHRAELRGADRGSRAIDTTTSA